MVSTLLVIGGVLVGLLVLLALIVRLSTRPTTKRSAGTPPRTPGWVADQGRQHPDVWDPLSDTSTSVRDRR